MGRKWFALGRDEGPEAPVQCIARLTEILRDTFWLEDFGGGEEIPITETVRRKASPQPEASAPHRRQACGINGQGKGCMREVMTLRPEPGVHHFRVVQSGHLSAG